MAEKWVVDGWDLALSGARGWEYREGTDMVAAAIGSNGSVPNRRGEIWRPKTLGPGGFTLGLWLTGADRAACETQFRNILRAVVRPHRLLTIERTLASGEVIQCSAEYAGSIKPQHFAQKVMKASLDFAVPDGVWRGQTTYTHSTIAGAALTQSLTLTNLEPSTAAIEDGTFIIDGPITNPHVVDVTDGVDGDDFYYNASLAAGQTLTVNCATWTVTGGGGHTAQLGKVFPSGRRLLSVPAARPGQTPKLELRGTGGGTGTRLTFSGKKTYAC